MAFWGWDRVQWERTVAAGNVDVRQLLIAVAYQLCGINDLHWEIRGFKMRLFCGRVFGDAAVEETVSRIQSHLDTLGYAAQLRRPNLQRALYELMLAARSPLLDDLAQRPGLLPDIRDRTTHNPGRSGVEQLAGTMVDMGVLSALPFPARLTRNEWLARSRAGDLDVPELWLEYAKRWFQTSTLTRSSRSQTYFALIKLGRWINHEQPEHADPGSWTRVLVAGRPIFADQTAGSLQGRELPSPHCRSVPLGRQAAVSGSVNHRIPTRREPKMSASAPAVNSVCALVGNLTADPVLKQLGDDRKVCQLRLAVNDPKDQSMFIDVATFGAQADACAEYLATGRAVAGTGRLVYREWDDNGTRRRRHHIVGRVQFGGKPNGDEPAESTTNSDDETSF